MREQRTPPTMRTIREAVRSSGHRCGRCGRGHESKSSGSTGREDDGTAGTPRQVGWVRGPRILSPPLEIRARIYPRVDSNPGRGSSRAVRPSARSRGLQAKVHSLGVDPAGHRLLADSDHLLLHPRQGSCAGTYDLPDSDGSVEPRLVRSTRSPRCDPRGRHAVLSVVWSERAAARRLLLGLRQAGSSLAVPRIARARTGQLWSAGLGARSSSRPPGRSKAWSWSVPSSGVSSERLSLPSLRTDYARLVCAAWACHRRSDVSHRRVSGTRGRQLRHDSPGDH